MYEKTSNSLKHFTKFRLVFVWNFVSCGFPKYTPFIFALDCILSISGNILKYTEDLIPLIFGNMMSGSVSDFHNQLF